MMLNVEMINDYGDIKNISFPSRKECGYNEKIFNRIKKRFIKNNNLNFKDMRLYENICFVFIKNEDNSITPIMCDYKQVFKNANEFRDFIFSGNKPITTDEYIK